MELNLYRLGIIISRLERYGSIPEMLDYILPTEFGKYQSTGEMIFSINGELRFKAKQGSNDEYLVFDCITYAAIRIPNLAILLDHISRELSSGDNVYASNVCKNPSFEIWLAEKDRSDNPGEVVEA